jgi:D-alanyl-D-alanine carboxypeptidase
LRARRLIDLILVGLALALAACGGSNAPYTTATPAAPEYAPTHYYPPPGPPDDPWGPYIAEAAARFAIPPAWIRAVMAQESGGEEQAVSPTGAMGLMQIEPATWQGLQAQYGLGDDPFNPRDNIIAGAGYIQQMAARYGAPGFLAAYNAGPSRLDDYIANGTPLPDETVNYLAAVTPNLGTDVAFSGPLATYAGAAGGLAPTIVGFATGCDVNAAYDPDRPCRAGAADNQAGTPPATVATDAGACDADTAYDPASPCQAAGGAAGRCSTDRAYDPDNPCHAALAPVLAGATVVTDEPMRSAPAGGDASSAVYDPNTGAPAAAAPAVPAPPAVAADWSVQVGAFASPSLALAVAQDARAQAGGALDRADDALPPTSPFGGRVLYRAQLTHLTAAAAIRACVSLNARQLPCIVRPGA